MYKNNPEAIKKYADKLYFGGNREIAIERDGHKCVKCGMTRAEHKLKFKRDITVDHIDGKGSGVKDKNNDLSNLQTLCCTCHGRKDIGRNKNYYIGNDGEIKKCSKCFVIVHPTKRQIDHGFFICKPCTNKYKKSYMSKKNRLYFKETEQEFCYSPEDLKAEFEWNGLESIKVYEAIPDRSGTAFWCKAHGECFERGSGVCGYLECDSYKPRNGKNGACTEMTHCYNPSKEALIFTKDGLVRPMTAPIPESEGKMK